MGEDQELTKPEMSVLSKGFAVAHECILITVTESVIHFTNISKVEAEHFGFPEDFHHFSKCPATLQTSPDRKKRPAFIKKTKKKNIKMVNINGKVYMIPICLTFR